MKIEVGLLVDFYMAASLVYSTFLPQNKLYAQDQKYPFQDYGDRKEGIVRKEQLDAGERLLIISAVVENRELLPAENASSYNLKFYLKDTSRVSIDVWELLQQNTVSLIFHSIY